MKIILTESQYKLLVEQNIEFQSNINPDVKFIDTEELNNILIKLKKDGYYSYINQKDIFNYINKLPQGSFIIIEYTGQTESDTIQKLNDKLIKTDREYNEGKGAPRFIVIKEQPPKGTIQKNRINVKYGAYSGVGIILKLNL